MRVVPPAVPLAARPLPPPRPLTITAKDHPPGIASVAVYDLQSYEVQAFTRADAPPSIEGDAREIDLLDRFYTHLDTLRESRVLHWNMNRPEFGFAALETRYRYLTENAPSATLPRRLYDVDTLIASRYGNDYAPHGKLESTARLNALDLRSFMSGRDEASQYEKADWSALSRSTASKAKIIGELLRVLVAGTLKTADTAGSIQFASATLDAVATVLEIGQQFLLVQRRLGKHPHGGPGMTFDNEWDDQYLFGALLVQFFEDVRDEEYSPSYAGGGSRIDFLLPDFQLGIELKHARASLDAATLGGELVVDRDRYKGHPSVTHLIALVFDYGGKIRNPRGIEKDLRRAHSDPELAVTVRIYDR